MVLFWWHGILCRLRDLQRKFTMDNGRYRTQLIFHRSEYLNMDYRTLDEWRFFDNPEGFDRMKRAN
jgi:hypothetical protein